MADLSTTYMGVALKNPLIVAASSISNYVDKVKKAEEVGAGALVIRSLFSMLLYPGTSRANSSKRTLRFLRMRKNGMPN